MPLMYAPKPGTIVICDYATGFKPPEMVKARPVVIVSPRRRTSNLFTVVPLSSVAPQPIEPWHVLMPSSAYPPAAVPLWAKCDMVNTVSRDRLDRVKVRDRRGNRSYTVFHVSPELLADIRTGIRAALEM